MSTKKTYSSPSLYRVDLDPDQAILSACSIATSAAYNNGSARCNTVLIPCKRISFNIGDSGVRPS